MPPERSTRAVCLAALVLAGLAAAPPIRASTCPAVAASERPAPAGPAEVALERGNRALARDRPQAALDAYQESERLARAEGRARLSWIAAANGLRAAVEAGESAGVEERLAALAGGSVPAHFRPTLLIHLARTWLELASRDPEREGSASRRAEGLLREAEESAEDPRTRSFALGFRGSVYEAAGRLAEARTLTRRALLEATRAGSVDSEYRWYWQLGRIERSEGEAERALSAFRAAVRGLDAMRAELALGSAHDAFAFRESVEPVYLDLVDLQLRQASDETAGEGARQTALREARRVLESLKAAELRDYYGDPCLAAQAEIEAEALPGVVVLYPVVLPDRVELIVGSAEGLSVFRAPVDGPTLIDSVRRFRKLLTNRTTRQYLPLADQLYDWLIRPAAPVLAGREISALVVVPGGALRTIPFAALRDSRQGVFLVEKVPLATAPGLSLINPRPIGTGLADVLAVGVSESVHGFPALPMVSGEIAAIEARFDALALVDQAFRAERFVGELRERPFGVVHVASHGEFGVDTGESFILAYDRKLSMQELGEAVGRTRLRTDQPLELLALSACQTAAGDDRAALGLAGVALRAGARSALATLWSVSDEATSLLVERFYAELGAGASRAEALRRAQRELLANRAFRHPGYWAPYLMINSWL